MIKWLLCAGNENLHLLTYAKRQRLRIDMRDWEGNTRYAEYDNFKVGTEHEQYKLTSIGHYSGNAGKFSTKTDIILFIWVRVDVSALYRSHTDTPFSMTQLNFS